MNSLLSGGGFGYNLLSEGGFWGTWYASLLVIVAEVILFFLIAAVLYRFLFKDLLNVLFALIFIVALSWLFILLIIAQVIYGATTKNRFPVFTSEYYAGKLSKPVALHFFTTEESVTDGEGRETGERLLSGYGKFLRKTGLYKLPHLLDVLCLRFSFVGVKPMRLADTRFMTESEMKRFQVRPGLICYLVGTQEREMPYSGMFREDARYAAKYSLGKDIKYFLLGVLRCIRGEDKSYLGEAQNADYAEVLLRKGEIAQRDFDLAREDAEKELAEFFADSPTAADTPDRSDSSDIADTSDNSDRSDKEE